MVYVKHGSDFTDGVVQLAKILYVDFLSQLVFYKSEISYNFATSRK
jgi:hypothetical protein